jgi:cobalt/nickel transport system permease protein
MHIPQSMLHGSVCPVTLGVSAIGVALATRFANKAKNKPSAAKFAAVTALVFALQMLNFPISNGTSGHLMGAILAVALLEIPFAILAMSLVLAVQAIFFADGGINALGANILNMALIGAGVGGLLLQVFKEKIGNKLALPLACWVSVMLAALACSLEVALAGAVSFSKVIPAMLGVHAVIGVGEIAITALVLGMLRAHAVYSQREEKVFVLSSFTLAVGAVFLSPFASSFPDGLEYVASKFSFVEFSAGHLKAIFSNYQVTMIPNSAVSTIVAGLAGVVLVTAGAYFTAKVIHE